MSFDAFMNESENIKPKEFIKIVTGYSTNDGLNIKNLIDHMKQKYDLDPKIVHREIDDNMFDEYTLTYMFNKQLIEDLLNDNMIATHLGMSDYREDLDHMINQNYIEHQIVYQK